jgi:hypothetical protein
MRLFPAFVAEEAVEYGGMVRVLPPEVAQRIAAEEVIERPASAAKELIENSLDAEAGRIEVEIEDGGITLIRVSDDGSGMAPEDAERAITEHATSKIRTADALASVVSLGFAARFCTPSAPSPKDDAYAACSNEISYAVQARSGERSCSSTVSRVGDFSPRSTSATPRERSLAGLPGGRRGETLQRVSGLISSMHRHVWSTTYKSGVSLRHKTSKTSLGRVRTHHTR